MQKEHEHNDIYDDAIIINKARRTKSGTNHLISNEGPDSENDDPNSGLENGAIVSDEEIATFAQKGAKHSIRATMASSDTKNKCHDKIVTAVESIYASARKKYDAMRKKIK